MNHKLFGFFSSREITFMIGLAIVAPTTLGAVTAFTNVALQDPTTGARARVNVLGALQTQTLPTPGRAPFFYQGFVYTGGSNPILQPTSAIFALNTITVESYFDQTNGAKMLLLFDQYFSDSSATCNNNLGSKLIGSYGVSAGETIHLPFPNGGLALQPQTAGGFWCLSVTAYVQGSPASTYPASISYSGYVVSGSYVQPAAQAAASGKPPVKH